MGKWRVEVSPERRSFAKHHSLLQAQNHKKKKNGKYRTVETFDEMKHVLQSPETSSAQPKLSSVE